MVKYTSAGCAIEGKKILCQFKDNPQVNERGGTKKAVLKGNPAFAVISKVWKHSK
jgi:hypothetical protein